MNLIVSRAFFPNSDVGFHVAVGKPVCGEGMSSVAEFECDRGKKDGLCKGVQQRPRAEEVLGEHSSGWPGPKAQ